MMMMMIKFFTGSQQRRSSGIFTRIEFRGVFFFALAKLFDEKIKFSPHLTATEKSFLVKNFFFGKFQFVSRGGCTEKSF